MPMPSMSVRFWGVRRSIACPGVDTARYGGHTPCVEVRCGGPILILDAGTGIRPLGMALMREQWLTDIDNFLSHFHIDHVTGLPFCLRHCFRSAMLFASELATFQAKIDFRDFSPGDMLKPELFCVPRHSGYRVDYGARSIAYLTDMKAATARLMASIYWALSSRLIGCGLCQFAFFF